MKFQLLILKIENLSMESSVNISEMREWRHQIFKICTITCSKERFAGNRRVEDRRLGINRKASGILRKFRTDVKSN